MKNPAAIALASCESAASRCAEPLARTLIMGVLGGGFVALGGFGMTTVGVGMPAGMAKFIGGLVFCVGLILVVIAGGQLFTGNCIMPIGALSGFVDWGSILRNWVLVYAANFVGSLAIAWLIYISGLWKGDAGAVGARALNIAAAKMSLPFVEAFVRGMLCNWLVTLAVWMATGADEIIGKVWAIVFPIATFVLSGFEHCVANMYFLPLGLMLSREPAAVSAAGFSAAKPVAAVVNWSGLWGNLLSVSLGNLVGGVLFVAIAYAFAFHPHKA